MHRARPRKYFWQERKHQGGLVGRLRFAVAAGIGVVRLIPDVPAQNPLVVCKRANDAFDITFEPRVFRGILQRAGPRTLQPAGIVNARRWLVLRAELRIGVPAGIEENQEWFDAMLCRNTEKCIDTMTETCWVLLPRQIVEEYAHGVEAKRFGPPTFGIYALGIKCVRLPHLQLVDCVCSNIVAADKPRLPAVPIIGTFFSPALGLRLRRCHRGKAENNEKKSKHFSNSAVRHAVSSGL